MKVRAIYHHRVEDDGREVHAIDHDGGGFVVSSREVGVAIQNFLHYATLTDLATLHSHILREYARRNMEAERLQWTAAADPGYEAMRQRGFSDGENAASWLIDGNTPDPFMFLSRLLTGMEEGDPEVMDSLPHPRVSGEWADDPTWEQICQDELRRYGTPDDDSEEAMFAVYTEAFHEGVEAQIRKMYNDYSPNRKV